MIVLGSTYKPMMSGIRARLGSGIELRNFDETRLLAEQRSDADVLLPGHQRIGTAELAVAPRLRLVQQHGRGVDSVDLETAQRYGVKVANVPGGNSVAVAEQALALTLALARQLHRMPECIANRLTGQPMGIELRSKTIALVGSGASGSGFAFIARALACAYWPSASTWPRHLQFPWISWAAPRQEPADPADPVLARALPSRTLVATESASQFPAGTPASANPLR